MEELWGNSEGRGRRGGREEGVTKRREREEVAGVPNHKEVIFHE